MILRVDKHPVIGESDIAPHLNDLFSGLFAALSHQGNHENEYIMRGSPRQLFAHALTAGSNDSSDYDCQGEHLPDQ